MAIFNGYVKLPEGSRGYIVGTTNLRDPICFAAGRVYSHWWPNMEPCETNTGWDLSSTYPLGIKHGNEKSTQNGSLDGNIFHKWQILDGKSMENLLSMVDVQLLRLLQYHLITGGRSGWLHLPVPSLQLLVAEEGTFTVWPNPNGFNFRSRGANVISTSRTKHKYTMIFFEKITELSNRGYS